MYVSDPKNSLLSVIERLSKQLLTKTEKLESIGLCI